jgi:hypothetical protein
MAATLSIQRYGLQGYQDILAYNRSYQKANRKRTAKWSRDKCARIKRRCFELYGSSCKRCGFTDFRALQIDHIQGVPRGMRRLKQNPHRGGTRLYAAIVAGRYNQDEFQLLCANCNWIKRVENNECDPARYQEAT